jgi:hypothetical protein
MSAWRTLTLALLVGAGCGHLRSMPPPRPRHLTTAEALRQQRWQDSAGLIFVDGVMGTPATLDSLPAEEVVAAAFVVTGLHCRAPGCNRVLTVNRCHDRARRRQCPWRLPAEMGSRGVQRLRYP